MSGTELVHYDAMRVAIAAAFAVDEVKDIRDKARAIELYAMQARNFEAETKACEIRLRAERRCGQLLKEREMAKNQHVPVAACDQHPQTLSDLGISKTQSSRWQKLAAIPEDEFEATFAGNGPKPTTAGLIAAHTPPAPKPVVVHSPVDDRALWLWGCLLDFERTGLLSVDPNVLTATMLQHMRETTQELAPQVAAWIGRIR